MRQRYRPPRGPFLEARSQLKVRFHEVDSLRIVWHGHYFTYFEQGREALSKYGLSYTSMLEDRIRAPIIHASCDYAKPALYGDTVEVISRLHYSRAAKLEISFKIVRVSDGAHLASGWTVQAFTDLEGRLLLNQPTLLRELYERWASELSASEDRDD